MKSGMDIISQCIQIKLYNNKWVYSKLIKSKSKQIKKWESKIKTNMKWIYSKYNEKPNDTNSIQKMTNYISTS